MKLSLRVKLTAAFLFVTLFLLIVVGVAANVFLEQQFNEYVIEKQAKKNQDIVALLSGRYGDWGGSWDMNGVENIGINMLSEGLMLRIKGVDGKVIWDANVHNEGFCKMMLEHMSQNMESYNPNFEGAYTEQTFPLISDSATIGSVDIGYYGPYFYSDNDIRYLGALNNLLLWAAAISALFAMLLGVYMAKRLTRPIQNVIAAARQIAKGDFDSRVDEKSDTIEIIELTTTINSLAETLGKQEALRKRLTGDVAHELRTPLATLQSHLEAMIDGIWKTDRQRLLSCHEETVRITKLVGDLEKLTQYEEENLLLVKEKFDISLLIKRIVLNFESQFHSKSIALNYQAVPQHIVADEDKISQVFINLLSNALKYTNEGGAVGICVAAKEEAVDIIIKDTGIGISESDLPNIFERFYRTDISRNRQTGGSGIGLTIAKAIVDAHNGTITVQSESGKGSTFTVSLPLDPK